MLCKCWFCPNIGRFMRTTSQQTRHNFHQTLSVVLMKWWRHLFLLFLSSLVLHCSQWGMYIFILMTNPIFQTPQIELLLILYSNRQSFQMNHSPKDQFFSHTYRSSPLPTMMECWTCAEHQRAKKRDSDYLHYAHWNKQVYQKKMFGLSSSSIPFFFFSS